jgi:hypothetical protein
MRLILPLPCLLSIEDQSITKNKIKWNKKILDLSSMGEQPQDLKTKQLRPNPSLRMKGQDRTV